MSKTISYKGQLNIGEQDRIRLKTNTGKTGYRITKFQMIISDHSNNTYELIAQIFKTDQTGSITDIVNFTNSDLLAVAFQDAHGDYNNGETIIFDNAKFNQDIFINITDAKAGTTPVNYYIELEAMSLSDIETTQLTLQSIRNLS